MFVMRLIANGVMYYLVEIDEGMSMGLVTVWALLGNKIQTFVDEQSAMRALEKIQEYPKDELGFMQWDDSDAKIHREKQEDYFPPPLRAPHYEIQIIDLTDMVVARQWKIDYMQ